MAGVDVVMDWTLVALIAVQVALAVGFGFWMGHRWGYTAGRSSMWSYCRELKKNLEAETEAKNRLKEDLAWEVAVDSARSARITRDGTSPLDTCTTTKAGETQ
jgi:hypothetical protein